jgi:hypothetical protein
MPHLGEKFGGNDPLFAAALNDTHAGEIDVTLIGALVFISARSKAMLQKFRNPSRRINAR